MAGAKDEKWGGGEDGVLSKRPICKVLRCHSRKVSKSKRVKLRGLTIILGPFFCLWDERVQGSSCIEEMTVSSERWL